MRGVLSSLLLSLALLSGCGSGEPKIRDYQIVVNGSTTPEPVEFTGSYACDHNGEERVGDFSGAGTVSTSFQCQRLIYARIQRVLGSGMVSLTVYEGGVAIFSTPPSDAVAPIVFVPE